MAVFDLEAVIKLTDQGFKSGLSKAGNAVKTFGKVAGVAIGAGAVAVAGLVKQSVSAYAEYEQLAGGVQKLFGTGGKTLDQYANSVGKTVTEAAAEWAKLDKAQKTVMENANQAYITTGQSANEYIDTVTGISAALINSYGGDTVKAAEQADKAMRAISDNFNTFGGDIEGVKSAYQGFAKQNYTMLDNLKLGYGGTKTEMERLISDANQYREELGLTGDLTIDKYGDIVEAIDLIQQKQGIAGTTAKEAAKTISGSLNMTKAAWKNLVRAFSDKDADLGQYFSALVTSAETAFNNLMPAVEQALTGIGDFIQDIAPVIGEKLPGLISSGLPKLISAGAGIVSSLISGIGQALPALVAALPDIFNAIKDGFVEAWPAIKEAGGQLMTMAGEGIKAAGAKIKEVAGNVWERVKEGASEKWEGIKGAVSEKWESLKSAITPDAISSRVGAAWDSIKSGVGEKWEEIKGAVSDAWENVKSGAAWESISAKAESAWSAVKGTVSSAWTSIKTDVVLAWDKVKGTPAWTSISSKAESAWSAITGTISGAWSSIQSDVSTWWESVKSTPAWESISTNASSAWSSFKGTVSSGWNTIKSSLIDAWNDAKGGPDWDLTGKAGEAWSSFIGAVSGWVDSVKQSIIDTWNRIVGGISFDLPELPTLSITGVINWITGKTPEAPSGHSGTGGNFAKANYQPYMFTNPSFFMAGEAGDEMLYGRSALMSDISDSVAVSNGALATQLSAILAELQTYLPSVKRPVVLDSGALVGGIGYDMDGFLGGYSEMGGRGLSLA